MRQVAAGDENDRKRESKTNALNNFAGHDLSKRQPLSNQTNQKFSKNLNPAAIKAAAIMTGE
jgi:hypothetical protein